MKAKFLINLKYYLNDIFSKKNKTIQELNENGVTIIYSYIQQSEADKIRLLIDSLIDENKFTWQDDIKSDIRIHGIEMIEPFLSQIFSSQTLNEIYKNYISKNFKSSFLMANKISYVKNNLGSGGGWHRDTMFRRQLKFILYVSDATESNGCFQYLIGSHKIKNKLLINKRLLLKSSKVRYKENEIQKLVSEFPLINFAGKKGDLLIVDTSGIHRGKPMNEGTRYAITNYLSDNKFSINLNRLRINK